MKSATLNAPAGARSESDRKRGRDGASNASDNATSHSADAGYVSRHAERDRSDNLEFGKYEDMHEIEEHTGPRKHVTLLKDGMTILDKDLAKKYARGSLDFNAKKSKHKHLRKSLEETKEQIVHSAARTAATEILLQSDVGCIQMDNPHEKVYKLTQQTIKESVDINTAKNSFDLQLQNFGPYSVNFSRNGRFVLHSGY
jgi:hypothetical protein